MLVSVSQHMRSFAGEDSEGSYQELDVALMVVSRPGFLHVSVETGYLNELTGITYHPGSSG